MKYALVHDTRIGARRVNQDRIGCWSTDESLLMAVADGLGGHLHGEVRRPWREIRERRPSVRVRRAAAAGRSGEIAERSAIDE